MAQHRLIYTDCFLISGASRAASGQVLPPLHFQTPRQEKDKMLIVTQRNCFISLKLTALMEELACFFLPTNFTIMQLLLLLWVLNLAWFLLLANALGLLVFLGPLREVGIVGQTTKQRRHLRPSVHLLLWQEGRSGKGKLFQSKKGNS